MAENEKDQQKTVRKAASGTTTAADTSATASAAVANSGDHGPAKQGTPERGNGGNGEYSSSPAPGAVPGIEKQGIDERDLQYMVTPRRSAGGGLGLASMMRHAAPDMDRVHEDLQKMSNVTVVRRIQPSILRLLGAAPGSGHDIVVVRVKAGGDHLLAAINNPALIVERDYLLGHLADSRPHPHFAAKVNLRPLSVMAASMTLQFHVQDTSGTPQKKSCIVVYTNAGEEIQAVSDQQGNASLAIPGGYINDVIALYVKPFDNCWESFTYRPSLQMPDVNTIVLKRLPEFPAAGFFDPAKTAAGFNGWGQRLMGLPQVALQKMAGSGVKVAIIDSGCDTRHPALMHIQTGLDYTNLNADHLPNTQSWRSDSMGHGTHCAGVIAGNGNDGHIRGFVPEAEIHVLKLFPGGAFNNLAAALLYCIDNQIDVVNCSLGGDQTSEAIEQLIETARQSGIAIVVAAGNTGAAVQFPARVSGALCVAAIGEQGEYPDNTYHAQTCSAGTVGIDGLFPANFSCHGPEVAFCAPGVAVISSVPGGGYAAWDGTSMAAPAITGLLALVLAHHPAFAGQPVVRSAQRVDRLFQLVASAATSLAMPPQQVGAGLPLLKSGGGSPPPPPSSSSFARSPDAMSVTEATFENPANEIGNSDTHYAQ